MSTDILHADGECPYCYTKISCYLKNEYKFGSPIRSCKKCGKSYVDSRYHEIAIDGFPQWELSLKFNVKRILIGIVIFIIGFLFLYFERNHLGFYHLSYYIIMFMGVLVVIFSLVDIIRIITGAKAKKFENLRIQSVERLNDKGYVQQLISIGYRIPNEFL